MTKSNIKSFSLRFPAALSCVTLLALAGCDSDEPRNAAADILGVDAQDAAERLGDLDHDIFEIDMSPDDEREIDAVRTSAPLARVVRQTSSVEWRDVGDNSEMLLVISGTADDAPLIDMDTAESLTPIEVWVAIADEPTAVPQRLLARATQAEVALLENPDQIDTLRAQVRKNLSQASDIQSQQLEPHTYGACTAAQVSAARSVFGKGYTPSSTCGEHRGFNSTNRVYWYCNSGSDCDYGLATQEGSCIPAVNSVAAVTGELSAVTMRSKTAGNPNFVTSSHRIRGFAYNCHGNGSLTAHMEYGGYTTDRSVNSGYYTGVVILGSGHLPTKAIAIDFVSYGLWDNGIGASGSTYQASEFSITGNAGAGDFGIFCTDAQKSLTMYAGPTGNAHSWCVGSCSVGNCWD